MPRNFCHFHGAGRGGDGVSPGQAGRASLILDMVLNQSSSDTSLYQYGWCLFLKEILSSLESSWYVTFAFPFFTCFFQNQLSVLRETFAARWRRWLAKTVGDDRGMLIKEATRGANNRSCYKNEEQKEEERRTQFEKNCSQIGIQNVFWMNIFIIYLACIVERCLGWL